MFSKTFLHVILLALVPIALASPVQLDGRDTAATNIKCTDKAA